MLSVVTSFFFVRITRWVVLILYFSPLHNSFLYTSQFFIYFDTRHLLKNIFHYASPCCVYSLTRHWLRQMFQYTSHNWNSAPVHVTWCVRSLVMRHGWFHSVRFNRWISFHSLFGCSLPSSQETECRFRQGTSRNIGWLTSRRYRSKNDSLTKNEDLLIISQ